MNRWIINIDLKLNKYLRYGDGNNNDFNDIIKNIDVSFSNVSRTEEDVIVFRHLYFSCREGLRYYYYSLKEDDMIKDKAYMGT